MKYDLIRAQEQGRHAYHDDTVNGWQRNPYAQSSRAAQEFDQGFQEEANLHLR